MSQAASGLWSGFGLIPKGVWIGGNAQLAHAK
jgi:hypothetical protein